VLKTRLILIDGLSAANAAQQAAHDLHVKGRAVKNTLRFAIDRLIAKR